MLGYVRSHILSCYDNELVHLKFESFLESPYLEKILYWNRALAIIWYNYMKSAASCFHDDVIKWKHFSRYWPFMQGIHRSPVNSLHKGQWRRALMFSLIWAWTNGWVNNWDASDLRCHRAHYNVTVMFPKLSALLVPLWGESTGHRRILLTKASDAESWCFLWSAPEQTGEQTIEALVIWDAIVLIMMSL